MAYMIFATLVVHVGMQILLTKSTKSSTEEDYEIDLPEK